MTATSSNYFKAAIPEPYRILGLALKPLSLGRYRLLRRFDVAFVADGPSSAGPADLILGLVICSQRCEDFIAALDSTSSASGPKFSKEIRRWSRKLWPGPSLWLGLVPWVGRRWRRDHGFDFSEKIRLFKAYIEEASRMPAFWDEGKDQGQASGAHWSQAMEVVLRSKLGWSRQEIDEEPLSKAFADYLKFAEDLGAIRLMTEGEMEIIAKGDAGVVMTGP